MNRYNGQKSGLIAGMPGGGLVPQKNFHRGMVPPKYWKFSVTKRSKWVLWTSVLHRSRITLKVDDHLRAGSRIARTLILLEDSLFHAVGRNSGNSVRVLPAARGTSRSIVWRVRPYIPFIFKFDYRSRMITHTMSHLHSGVFFMLQHDEAVLHYHCGG